MPVIDTYRPGDRDQVSALYRRVFGHDMAEASRLRWDWQYARNPNNPASGPLIWLAREGPAIVGQYATMPVKLSLSGREIDAAWGMDVMVAPERQRQGLGEILFGTWDKAVGASLGLGLSQASWRLFKKLRWPQVGPVPCLVKPLTRRALRQPGWPDTVNRVVSAVTLPVVKVISRPRPLRGETALTRRFDDRFTALWERLAPRFAFAVRRDAPYLQWKFVSPPHVRYQIVVLFREGEPAGYAAYRHAREPRGKVTLLVDFLTDPDDRIGFETLLRWVDREARAADSDKIRAFCMHEGFRRTMRRNGYFQVKSSVEFVARVNALPVGDAFYGDTSTWHVTLGDSDQDR
jgi:hypothetical protein